MSDDLGIGLPRDLVRNHAIVTVTGMRERLRDELPWLGADDIDAIGDLLRDAYYAGAILVAGEISDRLARACDAGRLYTFDEDGLPCRLEYAFELEIEPPGDDD